MTRRVLKFVCTLVCIAVAAGCALLAHGQGPGGPPHGGPPPSGTAPGGTGPGGSGSGGPSNGRPSALKPQGANGGTRPSGQFGPVGRWWDDKSIVQTIGLRKEQQKKMDVIFNNNKPAILESYKTFLSEQSKLDAINKNLKADQATTFAAIDSVSKARASLQKATAQMLLQIRQEMDPDQIAKLESLP